MKFKELAEKLEMEEDELLEIIGLFLEASLSDLSQLQSAVDQNDATMAVEAAHSIKGSAATLRFQEIYEIAKRMEMKARESHLEDGTNAIRMIREKLNDIADSLNQNQESSGSENS